MRLRLPPLIAALLLSCALPSAAAPFAIQLGDTRIAFDVPPGYADTTPTGSPRLAEFAETLTPASNRILLFAISDADLRRFGVGDPPDLRRYMIAATPRSLERDRVSASRFAALADESLKGAGAPIGEADAMKQLERLAPGGGAMISVLRKGADEVAVLHGVRLPPARGQDKPLYLLSTTSLLHLRGRAINLGVFTAFESQADLDWIRTTTLRWIEDLQRLNGR